MAHPFLINMFTGVEGSQFLFLFAVWRPLQTSFIVHIIFSFWSLEIRELFFFLTGNQLQLFLDMSFLRVPKKIEMPKRIFVNLQILYFLLVLCDQ